MEELNMDWLVKSFMNLGNKLKKFNIEKMNW